MQAQNPMLERRRHNLGVFIAMYSSHYADLIRMVESSGVRRNVAEAAVQRAYASVLEYLKTNDVPMSGDPTKFVMTVIYRAAMQDVGGLAHMNGRRHRARANAYGTQRKELEPLSYDELVPLVKELLLDGISVLVRGSPGIGKSALAKDLWQQIDQERPNMNYTFKDIRISQIEPQELAGVFYPNLDADLKKRRMYRVPPDWLVTASEQPTFLFLDEINAGVSDAIKAAAYQLVLDRRLGDVKLHPETVVMAAGNLETDEALAEDLGTALGNRFAHFVMEVDVGNWLKYAKTIGPDGKPNIHPYVTEYIESKSKLGDGGYNTKFLFKMKGDAGNPGNIAWPSPRTWGMVSKVLYARDAKSRSYDPRELYQLVRACVGEEAASAFREYFLVRLMYSPVNVLVNGKAIEWEKEFDTISAEGVKSKKKLLMESHNQHGLLRAMGEFCRTSEGATPQVAQNVIELMKGLPSNANLGELRTSFLQEFWNKNKPLTAAVRSHPDFKNLMKSSTESALELFRESRSNPSTRRSRRMRVR